MPIFDASGKFPPQKSWYGSNSNELHDSRRVTVAKKDGDGDAKALIFVVRDG